MMLAGQIAELGQQSNSSVTGALQKGKGMKRIWFGGAWATRNNSHHPT